MERTILFVMPSLQAFEGRPFRLIKYSRFPPLSLLTLAGLTPADRYKMIVRDGHIESDIVDEDVDLVAIQVYISSAHRAYELADHYRQRGAKIVMGGLHATSMPNEAAQHADAVCIGPAETVWSQILEDFESGSLRQFYRGRRKGSAALTAIPRRDLMNPKGYLIPNTMVTSRGCPHSCAFCYKTSFWGKRFYEARPVAHIEAELATMQGNVVFFLDDNLLANRRHARELFAVLRGSGIVWQAAASLDVTRDPGYLEEAYESGCRSLFVGFESLSEENMRGAGKSVNVATDYAEAIRRFHDAGMMINSSFVFGFDFDGPDVFDRTVEFAIENKLETGTFHIFTPLPGTAPFEQMEAEGRLLHRNWSYYDTDHAVFRPRRMSPEVLEAGHKRVYHDFLTYGSILKRSLGTTGAAKRIAYNVAWMKVDPLWEAIIRLGLMPQARRVFSKVLTWNTRPGEEQVDERERGGLLRRVSHAADAVGCAVRRLGRAVQFTRRVREMDVKTEGPSA